MSYEVYTSRQPSEPKWENNTFLLETRKPYWSRLILVGKGEHEGTHHSLTREQLYAHKFANERELAALLDRLFQRAHYYRLSRQRGDADPKTGGRR